MTSGRYVVGSVGSNGTTAASPNSGGDVVASGGTAVLTNTPSDALIGALGILETASTTSGAVYVEKSTAMVTAGTDYAADHYFYWTAYPSAETPILGFWAGSPRQVSLAMSTTGQILVKDKNSTTIATLPIVPLNTLVRVALYAHQDATNGTIRGAWFFGHSSTPAVVSSVSADSEMLTGRATGTAAYSSIRGGVKCSTSTATGTAIVASHMYNDAATDIPPPYNTNTAPTISLASDKAEIFPGETATITATATDSDGTIVSTVFSTTVGTLVGSGSSRTLYCDPRLSATTATITCVVTDDGGLTATATVDVTLRASMRKIWNGTTWVPTIRRMYT